MSTSPSESPIESHRVVLYITGDRTRMGNPAKWDWPTLLGLDPAVAVVGRVHVSPFLFPLQDDVKRLQSGTL